MPKVHLITIGDELLIGQVVDSNSAFLGKILSHHGFKIQQISSISDQVNCIKKTLSLAMQESEIIITTGGLGPTKDDKTKQAISEFFGSNLVLDSAVWQHIQTLFRQTIKREPNDLNKQQAMLPQLSEVLFNAIGTAPGIYTEFQGKVFVNLPGVPTEMKKLAQEQLIPRLKHKYQTPFYLQRNLLITGLPESQLAVLLDEWEEAISQQNIQYAYLPSGSRIRLRLTTEGFNKQELEKKLNLAITSLQSIIPKHLKATNSNNILELIAAQLNAKQYTISTAESCTGGEIARRLISISGASSYFAGSMVTYQTNQKLLHLGVTKNMIDHYTVVSEQVAKQMAKGGNQSMQTNICVATTGVAGPNKGEDQQAVGTVWIAIHTPTQIISKQLYYPNLERNDWIASVSNSVLNLLYKTIENEK